jgi:probable phosphoglycerate mutase
MIRAEALKIHLPMTQPLMDWIAYPGAESWRSMMQRVGMFVGDLLERDAPVGIIVTHRNVIAALVQWWLRLNDEIISTTDFDADPASLAILSTAYWGGRVIAKRTTPHLP